MFAVNVLIGNTTLRLMFRDEEKAKEVQAGALHPAGAMFDIVDDYGQHLIAKKEHIVMALLEDFEKTKMANVELFLHQQRVQNLATKAAQSDPGLRASAMMNGPAVLQPGGFPRN